MPFNSEKKSSWCYIDSLMKTSLIPLAFLYFTVSVPRALPILSVVEKEKSQVKWLDT